MSIIISPPSPSPHLSHNGSASLLLPGSLILTGSLSASPSSLFSSGSMSGVMYGAAGIIANGGGGGTATGTAFGSAAGTAAGTVTGTPFGGNTPLHQSSSLASIASAAYTSIGATGANSSSSSSIISAQPGGSPIVDFDLADTDALLLPIDSVFTKTLASDVADAVSLKLLSSIRESEPAFLTFDDLELSRLASYLSVLSLESGEKIIAAGEEATFCGVVLSGVFEAALSNTMKVQLRKGALIGEMSYFEGGRRSADITTVESGLVAVISFPDLEKLAQVDAELVAKFVHVLAVVSIRKLRKTANALAASTAPTGSSLTIPTSTPRMTIQIPPSPGAFPDSSPPTPLPPSSSSSVAATPSSSTAPSKNESIFVTRLKQSNLTHTTLAIKVAQASARKLAASSKLKTVLEHKVANLESRCKNLLADLLESRNDMVKQKDAMVKLRERAKAAISVARAESKLELETALGELTRKHDLASSVFRDLQSEADSNLSDALYKASRADSATATVHVSLNESVSRSAQANLEIEAQKLSMHHLSLQVSSQARTSAVLREEIASLQEIVRLGDAARKSAQAQIHDEILAHQSWKSKADLYLGDFTRLNIRLREVESSANELLRQRRMNLRTIVGLTSLVQRIIVRNFVRNSKTRRVLLTMFKRVNLVMQVRESPHMSSGSGSGAGSMHGPSTSSVILDPSVRSLARDRSKFLTWLASDRTSVSKLVWLLDEEMMHVETPFTALQKENRQLRHTLDAFFRRNIQLMGSFMNAKLTYEALHKEYAKCRKSWEGMRRGERERERKTNGNANANVNNAMFLDEDEESYAPTSFASSLPAPAPLSPGSVLRNHISKSKRSSSDSTPGSVTPTSTSASASARDPAFMSITLSSSSSSASSAQTSRPATAPSGNSVTGSPLVQATAILARKAQAVASTGFGAGNAAGIGGRGRQAGRAAAAQVMVAGSITNGAPSSSMPSPASPHPPYPPHPSPASALSSPMSQRPSSSLSTFGRGSSVANAAAMHTSAPISPAPQQSMQQPMQQQQRGGTNRYQQPQYSQPMTNAYNMHQQSHPIASTPSYPFGAPSSTITHSNNGAFFLPSRDYPHVVRSAAAVTIGKVDEERKSSSMMEGNYDSHYQQRNRTTTMQNANDVITFNNPHATTIAYNNQQYTIGQYHQQPQYPSSTHEYANASSATAYKAPTYDSMFATNMNM